MNRCDHYASRLHKFLLRGRGPSAEDEKMDKGSRKRTVCQGTKRKELLERTRVNVGFKRDSGLTVGTACDLQIWNGRGA